MKDSRESMSILSLLKSERAKKAYGVPGSAVNKILIVNHENTKERIHVIFVPESLGF